MNNTLKHLTLLCGFLLACQACAAPAPAAEAPALESLSTPAQGRGDDCPMHKGAEKCAHKPGEPCPYHQHEKAQSHAHEHCDFKHPK